MKYKTQCTTMKDWEFLNWIRDRLVNVYHESTHIDFVLRLEQIADELKRLEERRKR